MPLVFVNLLQSTGTKGGIEIYARELYRRLGERPGEFSFVGYASTELMERDYSWFPGEVIDSGISGENRLTWAFGELFSVARAAQRAGADLIHGPAMFGPLRPPAPLVISVHDLLYFSHPELMQTKLFTEPVKWMEKRGAAAASRLITISEYSASAIRRYLRFDDDRIDVIPLAGRAPDPSVSVGLSRASNLFLAIGQRSPYKDFATVVRAWAEIPEDERPRLVITGSHGDDPLIPLVRELGLERWVELKSWVPTEELSELFATATALIDSTLATGFSLPTLEAMGIGLPVILADTEVFREVGADAADYFTAGDPADLARAVRSLASQPERQQELTRLGLARSAQFSWEKVAEQTLESFRKALRQG
ncbi:glycosyltransferase family 4 protein [Salinibacterium sp. dk2585]|uniref:glycosyltransferase family 4 protein n=1 Tax=unclassified Salinibacterium TaxID=2632331 RepID=UPI0011C2437C|nr:MULTISPECIES: glycosyltransferase family 1 protein [unclassified Salinibacterium]QEE60858.1 glycosyltransferase family 4 protein [Salinibacterium sp. dk2585]TXK55930.1 glycosyltransferase family 4 protein [Salinibacterium sp. dk5596]